MSPLKVLETNILHASDVIYWLDAGTAQNEAEMLRISDSLSLQLSNRPADLQVVHSAGKTAFIRPPMNEILFGLPTEADKQRPPLPSYPLAGVVSDPQGRYNPRSFSITAGNGNGHGLRIYRSPLGTRFGPSGGLIGTLRFDSSGEGVPWALLTLVVTTAIGTPLTFRCQADGNGDFMLSMNRLPPLPEGIDNFSATLGIAAMESASADQPLDPAELVAMNLGDLDSDDTFSASINLTVIPGKVRLLRSSSQEFLAVQPS